MKQPLDGITTSYSDANNRAHLTSSKTRKKLRQAIGKVSNPGKLIFLPEKEPFSLSKPALLILENGKKLWLDKHLPDNLPIGYHTLKIFGEEETPLIIHPKRTHLPAPAKKWGWALQLYSFRSERSWGIGDFRDLREFARWSRQRLAADFLLLNPLGASSPALPLETSPYLPSSRLFIDPLYLCVEEVPGAMAQGVQLSKLAKRARALNTGTLIDRDKIFKIKQTALNKIYRHFKGHRGFNEFQQEQGETLFLFSVFCVLVECFGKTWRKWPENLLHPQGKGIAYFAQKHSRRVHFHQWLQWLLDEQFGRAAREIPLILDVPIGMDANGFDAWLWQDMLAFEVSIGCPPDAFNREGQIWGLPPFIPQRLRDCAYLPFRQTVRSMLRHARGLRVDHVMGLFRLFWVPKGDSARTGAYVRYYADEFLAILAIESQLANSIIIGEDLGTVERGVRPHLKRWGVLSYRLFWFENRAPEFYPKQALAAISTHDLYTVAGLWSGKDVEEQIQYGIHGTEPEMSAVRARFSRRVGLNASASCPDAILGAYRQLARTPCQLIVATLEDALCAITRPNMPGITSQRPNWCIALPKTFKQIRRDHFIAELAGLLKRNVKKDIKA